MINKKLFIFDLDGTLVDAYGAIEKSLNFSRHSLGLNPISLTKVRRNVGYGDKHFIGLFFHSKDIVKALEIYRAHHKDVICKYSKLKPNARNLLHNLKRKKKKIAIASNRPKKFTDLLLDKLQIRKYFDVIYCGDEIGSLKPDPKILNDVLKYFNLDKTDAVYVGDMDIDMETAKRAKIDAVFVKGGSSLLSEVKKYKDKLIVKDLSEFLQLLREQ